MRPKIVRRLTLAEVAALLGWTDPKDVIRATRRRLRRIEKRTGVKLIQRGGGIGNPSMVTWSALRHAGLVDDLGEAVDVLRDERDALADDVASLTRAIGLMAKRISRLEALVTATLEIPEVPKCPPLGGRGKGRADGASRARRTWPLPAPEHASVVTSVVSPVQAPAPVVGAIADR